MPSESPHDTSPAYAIGVVSKLTGIHPETLRMWERRYTVVQPGRSKGGSRRYSDADIQRLSLIKTLVDAGHQISTIAALSYSQLQDRLDATTPRAVTASGEAPATRRVILVGGSLGARMSAAEIPGLELAGAYDDETGLKDSQPGPIADVLVYETATVQAQTIGDVRRLLALSNVDKAIVVYGFGTRQALMQLEAAGVQCLRAPVTESDIASACLGSLPGGAPGPKSVAPASGTVPPRQFTPQQLARISTRAPVLACECPHHLVELINAMAAFETYSLECKNKNSEDAEVHALLHSTAGQARASLESALLRVAEFEGIDVS